MEVDKKELDKLYDKYFKYEVRKDRMTGKLYRIIEGEIIYEPTD
jgi:hypothetical protein